MAFADFVLHNIWVIVFYLAIILMIAFNWRKFEIQAKFIFLYKTQFGIKLMQKVADKYREWVKLFGYIAMGVGFVGMIVISYFMLKGLFDLLFVPSAPPTISPFIPGVAVPGSIIGAPPFLESIIALFLVVVIHEFSHGIVAKSHGLKIKNTGFVMFGPLPGAFVEPDDKEVDKKSDVIQYSIFAAGPFSNIFTGVIIALILGLFFMQGNCTAAICDVWNPRGMASAEGVTFGTILEDTPAAEYGLEPGVTYTQINDEKITTANDFLFWFGKVDPGESFTLTTKNGEIQEVVAGTHPDSVKVGYLGVNNLQTHFVVNNTAGWYVVIFNVLTWIAKVLFWIYLISLGLGLANLLPIGPVDGGRMLHTLMLKAVGPKKGLKIWSRITSAGVAILLILLFVPIIKAIFTGSV